MNVPGNARRRTVLIVSPYAPPSAMAGVHRGRHLLKHLPAHGWHPRLLCVDDRFYDQPPDQELMKLLPSDADVERVGALSPRLTRLLGIGDMSLRAFFHLRAAVLRAVARKEVDVALISGSPYYTMLLTAEVRRYGVPVVLDFQDPWVSRWGATRRLMSKAGMSHWLASRLEPIAVRNASFITSVSDQQNAEMLARYPELDPAFLADIPIGGDPEDFSLLRTAGATASSYIAEGKFNLSFVGTFMPRSGALMREFLAGVALFRTEHPQLVSRLRLNFIGTGNHSSATATPVLDIARQMDLHDTVHEEPRRISFSAALACLARSDALLLIGSDEPHYTASKIYPALMSGRPYLSLFHRLSSANGVLRDAGGGLVLAFDPAESSPTLQSEISAGLARLMTETICFGHARPESYAAFGAQAVAGRFAAIFDKLLQCA